MKVVYFQTPKSNFGDELNRWLWPRLIGDAISGFSHHDDKAATTSDPDELLFYGIGTILDNRIPQAGEKIIFGSGYGYGVKPEDIASAKIFFVRGKDTAKALNLTPDKALTDPAVLLRRFFPVVAEQDKVHDIAFMPHHSSVKGNFWRKACHELNIHYIDPQSADIDDVVKQIASSKCLIAEAMHGAIVADTFRVPWIAISSVKETNDFKWRDWCGTLGLDYAPIRFMAIYDAPANKSFKRLLNAIKLKIRKYQLAQVATAGGHKAMLSDVKVLNSHLEAMDEQVIKLEAYLHERGNSASTQSSRA